MALAEKSREEYGLNRCLRALGLSKGTWHRRQRRPAAPEKDRELKAQVLSVVEDHPAYGYRRIGAELRERTGEQVNHKRLRRLVNTWDLALSRKVTRPKPSGVRRILRTGRGKLDLVSGRETSRPSLLRRSRNRARCSTQIMGQTLRCPSAAGKTRRAGHPATGCPYGVGGPLSEPLQAVVAGAALEVEERPPAQGHIGHGQRREQPELDINGQHGGRPQPQRP